MWYVCSYPGIHECTNSMCISNDYLRPNSFTNLDKALKLIK